jgi:hypothetical protein
MVTKKYSDKPIKFTISQKNVQLKNLFFNKKLSLKSLKLNSTKLKFPRNLRNKVRIGHATLLRRRLVQTYHAGSKIGSGSGSGSETIWRIGSRSEKNQFGSTTLIIRLKSPSRKSRGFI